MPLQNVVILVLVGLSAGILSGFVGVGGGIIMVPALVWVMGYNQFQAQGTSLAVLMLPVVFLAARDYYRACTIEVGVVAIIAVAFLVGGYFGSKWSLALPVDTVQRIFGCIMLLAALKLIFGK